MSEIIFSKKKGIPDMIFWIIYNLVQISIFGRLLKSVLASVLFFNFFSSANYGGQHFYSASPPPPLPCNHHHHKRASYIPELCYILLPLLREFDWLCFGKDFFITFRELENSVFALNNVNETNKKESKEFPN